MTRPFHRQESFAPALQERDIVYKAFHCSPGGGEDMCQPGTRLFEAFIPILFPGSVFVVTFLHLNKIWLRA